MVSTIVPNRDTRDNRIRRCVNALLKFRFDVADAVKLAVLIPKEIELKLLALLDALQVFDVLGEDGQGYKSEYRRRAPVAARQSPRSMPW